MISSYNMVNEHAFISHQHLLNTESVGFFSYSFAENELLFTILGNMPLGISITDHNHHFKYVNKALCQILGYTQSELLALRTLSITHPDDLNETQRALDQLASGLIQKYQIKKRYIKRSGMPVWIQLTVSSLRDPDGRVLYHLCQVEDITLQHHAEEQLRLAACVYESSHEAMLITDEKNVIISVNSTFTKLTGYERGDVIGKSPRMLSSGRHSKDFFTRMYEQIEATNHWEGEVVNRRKNGEVYTEWLSISAVKNEGNITNYVALFSDVSAEKMTLEEAMHWANYDALTKLPNRRLFQDRLAQALLNASRNGTIVALLFIDLDLFKQVNDTQGHQIGDELLIQVGERLKSMIRATDTVARLGGDEFAIILPDLTDEKYANQIAKNILKATPKAFELHALTLHISCSVGVSFYPTQAKDSFELVRLADEAMYRVKKATKEVALLSAEYG